MYKFSCQVQSRHVEATERLGEATACLGYVSLVRYERGCRSRVGLRTDLAASRGARQAERHSLHA